MLTVLNPFDRNEPFPPVENALDEPNGLLAVGGCLSAHRLVNAYRSGIFPWFGKDEPILWWSPDPRLILRPDDIKISRSLGKRLKRGEFRFSFDVCFNRVVDACAEPRHYASGTWITQDMKRAYSSLFKLGLAHSFEAWQGEELVGGLYGVSVGRVFFGESMFHCVTDASKAAFAFACNRLKDWRYVLIDCQVYTRHLASLGAEEIPRSEFVKLLQTHCEQPAAGDAWKAEGGAL
ncbi:leucyl/phenylalanyl-tRNA--protein transferase [Methylocaldum sp.]|uniref:leucyl/phenylalanyl-tRNA--protein transferase n=1 Tax=Methylocaldum sp. TaxID=1969727 RepID=UPI002D3D4AAC|nr:leucyl/phenylalanyl-tRNA--protein transferase [Methylocaldum sp.]HYE36247.1 leucyl/phenylalanyl-tRNA--protein transferase [Methylocaldum sp.]